MLHNCRFGLISAAAVSLFAAGAAFAQEKDFVVENTESGTRVISDGAIFTLKPVVNRLRPPNVTSVAERTAGPNTKGVMTRNGPQFATRAFGTFGIPYTTTRVQEGNRSAKGVTNNNRLSTSYPYRAVGKLTFDQGFCSASVILRGIIVTAAHCIQSFGGGNSLFTNFMFTPGHYGAAGATNREIQPYGMWRRAGLVRPASWKNGTDIGCGAARDNDLAVMALRTNKKGEFIGDVVGWMGYGWNNYSFVTSPKTGNLHTAAVSSLGYPALMDGGAIMQRVDGPTYTTTVCSAGQIWQGSNFTGGSSGGPWVVNFSGRNAVLAGGAVVGTASDIGVIGVTSWGSADPNVPKDNYSSQFRQNTHYPDPDYGGRGAGNIGSLLNTLCSASAPGGGTYASQGFCD